MIKINVAQIKRRLVGEKVLAYDLDPRELDISPEELRVLGKVRLEGSLTNAGDVLLLQADLSAEVRRSCDRCLKEFVAVTEARVVEKFYPAGAENVEDGALVYDSDVLDITEPLREGLLLAEPMRALCKEDCMGLCSACGRDLNEGDCGCDRVSLDPRLAALKQFYEKRFTEN